MKRHVAISRRILPALLSALMLTTILVTTALTAVSAADSRAVVTTTPTGYTQSSDVVYKSFTSGKFSGVMNWGARGEDCTFLSPNAETYYQKQDYTYAVLSPLQGGSQSSAPTSDLYKALKAMMVAEHDYQTNYQETRPLYAFTDCVSNESSQLVSFYSGKLHTSVWDFGATWNREHTWPNSKGMNGNDENDIMMLRPTLTKENGSRGNKAYGESAGYFDPGESVRGDCARIVLYIYTRWGNTSNMWGTAGVMENVDVLLRWMAEDPVDTWEMGRNDAVESITGVRNVFVDFPEYAWLLFGEDVPADIVTPSGMARQSAETEAPTEPVTEAPTAPETEPATEPVTTPVTEAPTAPVETDPIAAESETTALGETDPETTASDETASDSAGTPDTDAPHTDVADTAPADATTTVSDTVLSGTPTEEVPESTADGAVDPGGCSSALAGGCLIIFSIAACTVLSKHRDDV